MAAQLRQAGISGWRRHVVIKLKLGPRVGMRLGKTELSVRPDFVFRTERVALFVDGCFWHRCPVHSRVPTNNLEFWERKLSRNVERDRLVDRELRKAGWKVRRVWEHDLWRRGAPRRIGTLAPVMKRVRQALQPGQAEFAA